MHGFDLGACPRKNTVKIHYNYFTYPGRNAPAEPIEIKIWTGTCGT